MCGRYALTATPEEIEAIFALLELQVFPPRYNIAPTQPVLVLRARLEPPAALRQPSEDGPGARAPRPAPAFPRELTLMRWGLVPSWAKDLDIGARLINARSETAAEKPAFRAAFRRRRCLVPADGFYEWRKLDGRKQPYHIRMADGAPFAIAGLWERWEPADGSVLESCTLLTTEANARVRPLHDRMPVILPPEDWAPWLDPELEQAELLQPLLRPFDPAAMTSQAVSSYVNSPRNEGPDCQTPVEVDEPPRLW